MKRRRFLRTGLLLSAAGVAGPLAIFGPATRGPLRNRQAKPLRLNSNENPLGLSPAARRAVSESLDNANRYPREGRERLIDAIAAHHRVPRESVVLGHGSTEVLQMAVQASGGPRTSVLTAEPTFEDVPRYSRPLGSRVETVPLDHAWAHDIGRMRERARDLAARGPVLVFICNPNNPTGTLTPSADVEVWIREAPAGVTFLVDEAYVEYAEDPAYRSADRMVLDHPNLVVTRTFSKIYGMAGMRLGYALAHPETAALLRSWAAQNNANHLALAAGLASFGDQEWIDRSLAVNRRGREILTVALNELGLEHLPSHANFMMHHVPGRLDTWIRRMRERGVLVGRPFPPMLNYNRVSIGLPEEMERFADILRNMV